MNSRPPISSVDPTEEAKHQHSSRKHNLGVLWLGTVKGRRAKVDKVEEVSLEGSDYWKWLMMLPKAGWHKGKGVRDIFSSS